MKHLWFPLTVALAASLPLPALAQTPPATRPVGGGQGTPGAGGQIARLFEGYRELLRSLDLSPQQQQAVSGVMQDAVAKMREMQGELQGLAPQERRAKIQSLVTELNSSLAAELTPEQLEAFRAGLQDLNRRNANAPGGTTRPAEGSPGGRPGAGGAGGVGGGGQGNPRQMLETFRDAVHALDLTEDQKSKVDAAMEDARTQMREAAQGGDPTATREAFLRVSQELREKVGAVLTPEQRDALREKMRQAMGEQGRGNERPGARERRPGRDAPKPEEKKSEDRKPDAAGDDMMGGNMGGTMGGSAGGSAGGSGGGTKSDSAERPAPPQAAAQPAPKVAVGQPAPELSAARLDGTAVKLSNYRNRPLVLIFGSYSSPTFREKAAMLNDLAKDYRGRAEIVIVYTAEAHPVGTPEVERNRDDKVRVEPHKTAKDRESAARDAKAALKLEPVFLVDSITDDTAKAYGLAPNGVAILARDGTIYATQRWLEPFALRATLDEALSVPAK